MKNFITTFVLLLWGGVISAQTFNNPEPSTHDVRDIFVGFEVKSSATNTKVTRWRKAICLVTPIQEGFAFTNKNKSN
jgi:hypothetical protein